MTASKSRTHNIGADLPSVRNRVGRGYWMAGASLAAVLSSTAFAQSTPPTPTVISPLRVEPDVNNLNLATGKTTIDGPVMQIPAAPRLKFDFIANLAPYVVRNISNGSAGLAEKVAAHYGGSSSEQFNCLDSECTSPNGTGSRMAGNQLVRAGEGEVYNFSLQHYKTATQAIYYASSVIYPDGEAISFQYDTGAIPGDSGNRTFYRPALVTSNTGYAMAITYRAGGTDASVTGWSTVSEARLYAVADPSTTLARLTFAANGSITDLQGRVFQCSGCVTSLSLSGSLESVQGSLTLPGEASPARQVTPQSGNPVVVSSIARDGVAYSYSYANLRLTGSTYLYDSVQVTGPNGYNKTYGFKPSYYGDQNLMTYVTDELTRKTTTETDSSGRLWKVTYPELNGFEVSYTNGLVSQKITHAKPGSGQPDLVEIAHYDEVCDGVMCYRPTYYKDALLRQTDYLYNGYGQLTQKTEPADANGVRPTTIIEYDTTGPMRRPRVVRLCGTGASCGTTSEIRTEYDYWGNTFLPSVERRIDAVTGTTLTTTYSYDAAGRLLSTDGPLPGTDDATYNRYDVVGRKTWEIGPKAANGLRIAKRYTYRDSDDKVSITETGTVTDPASATLTVLERTDVTYDSHRNATRTAVSQSGTTYNVAESSYDDRGRVVCQAVRMNQALFGNPLDACTQAGSSPGPYGPDRITHNYYDVASQLTRVEKGVGTTLLQDYVAYGYTSNGKRASVKDANGNLASLTYDGYDRQARWYFPSKTTAGVASTTDYEEYGYDAVGNRNSLRRRDGRTLTFTFDNLNRMTSKVVPDGCAPIQVGACPAGSATRDVYYGYDARGLQLYARFDSASGEGITNAYDGFGRLTSSTSTMGGVTRTLGSQYDVHGNRTQLTHPDGVYFHYDYDTADRMFHGDWWTPSGGTVPFLGISYDNAGRRSTISRANSGTSYGYDDIGRLTSQTLQFTGGIGNLVSGYGYNPASQIVSRTWSDDAYAFTGAANSWLSYGANGLNQYQTVGANTYQYDANGNLISDGGNSYGYDGENRLVSSTVGSTSATLAYDPLGRLFQVSGSLGTTQFLYDGDRLVVEYNASGGLLRRYAFGPNQDEPILWDEGGALNCSGTKFLQTNHQGSIIALADCAGNRTNVNAYDIYGVPNTSTPNVGRFQYTGQAWIPELRMYHYKARVYSPMLGRFFQTDPVGYEDQINLYTYVGNDPLNKADPSGECPACLGAVAGGVLDVLQQTLIEGKSLRNVDWVDVGISAAAGATGVGVLKVGGKLLEAELASVRVERSLSKLESIREIGQSGRIARTAAQARRAAAALGDAKQSFLKAAGAFAAVSAGKTIAKTVNHAAQQMGYDSAKVNSNGSVSVTFKNTGSRIETTVTCSATKGCH